MEPLAAAGRWQAHDWPCPFCASRSRRVRGRRGGEAHRGGLGVVSTVVRCRDCGGFYTSPTLVPRDNPYSDETAAEYFHRHDAEGKREDGRRLARRASAIAGRTGALLEIGCGRGDLLQGARDEGWDVYGVEMTPAFADEAERKGVRVERGPAEEARLLDERRFDAIFFAAVLEHLYRPVEVLRRARAALVPGGALFVDVPNEGSLAMALGHLYMRARGRDWSVNLSPTFSPFHVVGFTPRSLRRVLAGSGFEVVEMRKPRWSNELPPPRTLAARAESLGLNAASWLGSRIGMGDGICCWARAV